MADEGAKHLRPLVLGNCRSLEEIERGMLVIYPHRNQCHIASAVVLMLRGTQWVGARDAERVQKPSAQRARAVIEVVHKNLEFD